MSEQRPEATNVEDLQRQLQRMQVERAALERQLRAAVAESTELRARLEQLESSPREEASGVPGSERGRSEGTHDEETIAQLREVVAQAERQRRALAGLISDAADAHRAFERSVTSHRASRTHPPGRGRRFRDRLTRTPLAAPVRAVRRRRRHRPEQSSSQSPPDADGDRDHLLGVASASEVRGSAGGTNDRPIRLAKPPVVIDVQGLSKSFVIPSHRSESLKQRLLHHPLRGIEHRTLGVLDDVSFQVHQGEFLGVVGTNGAGKSTLLKTIAGTYQADHGSIKVAGTVAPLIELGVGFNPELSAHDNVILSGAMLGLSPDEARARFPSVIEFAGLQDFAELKLRNYSSGMRVRLAFAVMMHVNADVLLIDEVLSVGDTPFQERCNSALADLHREGKTILLVSHSMPKVRSTCDRAILLDRGQIAISGDPHAVALRYNELMDRRRQDGSSRDHLPGPLVAREGRA